LLRSASLPLVLALVWGASICASLAASKKQEQRDADAVFSSDQLLRIEVEVAPEHMDTLRQGQSMKGFGSRKDVPATVREGGAVYTNVALHLKGAIGSFRPVDQNPALTLNFDKLVKGQRFHGLQKIHLNNSIQDPTLASEQLCRELYNHAGLPTPRATHAVVRFNGRELGPYVLVEGADKPFLRRYFNDVDGTFYDGGLGQDLDGKLEVTSGSNPADRSEINALVDAAKEPDLAARITKLERALDLDRFLKLMAMDTLTWNWDGYGLNKNNYRLFHDRSSSRVVFIATGLDQTFQRPDASVMPPWVGMVAKAALDVPALTQRYLSHVGRLNDRWLDPVALTNRLHTIVAKVRPAVARANPDSLAAYDAAVADYGDRLARRAHAVRRQVDSMDTIVRLQPGDSVAITRWEPRTDWGAPQLLRTNEPRAALGVRAVDGTVIGGWRASVWAEKGRYSLEARLRTLEVVADPADTRGGAGLRIAGRRMLEPLLGTTGWHAVSFEFEVRNALLMVDLICDLRAVSGEVWIDESSLRLRRR
jgi:hypothetical protein